LKALQGGGFGLLRCSLLDPRGFRPITAETLILQADQAGGAIDQAMNIGPDAVL